MIVTRYYIDQIDEGQYGRYFAIIDMESGTIMDESRDAHDLKDYCNALNIDFTIYNKAVMEYCK